MDFEERERIRTQIADFRLSVVAELCNAYSSNEEKKLLLKEKAARQYVIPGSTKTRITSETIRSWATKYSLHGKEGLLPKQREDRGRPRSFIDKEAQAIIKKLEEKPELTVSSVIKKLKKDGVITSKISSSSLSRFIRANNLTKRERVKITDDKDQRRFAFEGPLECVQADAMHGFSVPDGKGKKRKAILLAFIDDATRRILYARFDFTERSLLFEKGINHILKAHGKIGRLYVDNGSTFVSKQTKRIVETLGIYIIHSKPYRPQGRGKIERFFRTVRQSFLRLIDEDEIQSLEQLNMLFSNWLETEYHREIHSSLGVTPLDAWLSKCERIKRMDPFAEIDEIFLHQTTRKVYKDSIVSVEGIAFEVPSVLIGERVTIIYDPRPPLNRITVKYNRKDYGEAKPVDLYANTRIKRNKNFTGEIESIQLENNQEETTGGLL
ncbi:MAG: DDE-type integrase/transposase/recombinase [Spirochaetota bacterium]|nr:DDE-type integrase/transposase/recombinase [Spirochaetota bacterium]